MKKAFLRIGGGGGVFLKIDSGSAKQPLLTNVHKLLPFIMVTKHINPYPSVYSEMPHFAIMAK